METCVGAHHLARKLAAFGHDARLMPANYVRPYAKGQKNDFNDAEAIAEAVQRPTMKFVATKTADQPDRRNFFRRTAGAAIAISACNLRLLGLSGQRSIASLALERCLPAIELPDRSNSPD